MPTVEKLVRDKIPNVVAESQPGSVSFRKLPEDELKALLVSKLHEEVEEFLSLRCFEEAADVVQVLYELMSTGDGDMDSFLALLRTAIQDKAARKGTFSQGYAMKFEVDEL